MLRLSFCVGRALPAPKFSKRSLSQLVHAMVADRLLSRRDATRLMNALALLDLNEVGLGNVEAVAPSTAHLTIRWLRGFFDEAAGAEGAIPLSYELPHVTAAAALASAPTAEEAVIEAPQALDRSILSAVEVVCASFGVRAIVKRTERGAARVPWREPQAVDLLAMAFGGQSLRAQAILSEVLESGGAVPAKVLLTLLSEGERRLLVRLVAFDFLQVASLAGGLTFALTLKALEALA